MSNERVFEAKRRQEGERTRRSSVGVGGGGVAVGGGGGDDGGGGGTCSGRRPRPALGDSFP